jgi:hypothetical protein
MIVINIVIFLHCLFFLFFEMPKTKGESFTSLETQFQNENNKSAGKEGNIREVAFADPLLTTTQINQEVYHRVDY